jgi:hypothetical protein
MLNTVTDLQHSLQQEPVQYLSAYQGLSLGFYDYLTGTGQ